jgi:hypothetical protein
MSGTATTAAEEAVIAVPELEPPPEPCRSCADARTRSAAGTTVACNPALLQPAPQVDSAGRVRREGCCRPSQRWAAPNWRPNPERKAQARRVWRYRLRQRLSGYAVIRCGSSDNCGASSATSGSHRRTPRGWFAVGAADTRSQTIQAASGKTSGERRTRSATSRQVVSDAERAILA